MTIGAVGVGSSRAMHEQPLGQPQRGSFHLELMPRGVLRVWGVLGERSGNKGKDGWDGA